MGQPCPGVHAHCGGEARPPGTDKQRAVCHGVIAVVVISGDPTYVPQAVSTPEAAGQRAGGQLKPGRPRPGGYHIQHTEAKTQKRQEKVGDKRPLPWGWSHGRAVCEPWDRRSEGQRSGVEGAPTAGAWSRPATPQQGLLRGACPLVTMGQGFAGRRTRPGPGKNRPARPLPRDDEDSLCSPDNLP